MSVRLNASLAWRAAAGRRTGRVSLTVRIIGVAFATAILLLASSADGALDRRGDRITWRTHWEDNGITPDNAWLQVDWTDDYFLEHQISRVRVVQHAPEAEVPPGLPRLPAPGEVFVSPALARLIDAESEALGQRYGDTIAGTITEAGLSDPDEFVAITGFAPGELPVQGILYRELPADGFQQAGVTLFMRIVVIIGVVVMLFPIAMFIAAAARLNAQESDARLAAYRLAGAEPQRVRWIVTLESLISALPGAVLGLLLFFAVRPLVAQVQFDGAAFLASDFALNGLSVLVILLVPAVVVGASFVGLRDVEISPLGVSRRSRRREVRPLGFVLLALGFVLLWYVLGMEAAGSALGPVVGLVLSILLILGGVALAGTWLGQHVARAFASHVRSGWALLAFRRIAGDPHASFRTVSGVTFAVFAGTLFLSLSAALEREVEVNPASGLRPDVIRVHHNAVAPRLPDGLPDGTVAVSLNTVGGVTDDGMYLNVQQADCDALARVLPMEGGCGGRVAVRQGSGIAPGDRLVIDSVEPPVEVTIPEDAHVFEASTIGGWWADVVVPAGTLDVFDSFEGGTLAVAPPEGVTMGDRAFEQIRSALIRAFPAAFVSTGQEFDESAVGGLASMRNLVYMGTFAAFLLSGGTAAMAVAASILARRQAFALLRMSGLSLGVLRRAVMAEATLPLVLVSAMSAGTAVAVSALMIWRIGQGSVLPPPAFALPLVAGLLLGLALPLVTLPLLGSVTRTEQTRFD